MRVAACACRLSRGFDWMRFRRVYMIQQPRAFEKQIIKFMNEKVPGIDVPEEVINRVEKSTDQAEEAYKQTLEFAQHALSLPGVRGLHVTDFRHDETLDRFMHDLGRVPKSSN